MPSAAYTARVQRAEDATARAITRTEHLVQMELFVRGQLRRCYTDEHTAALVLADIERVRDDYTELRAELAALRNGG